MKTTIYLPERTKQRLARAAQRRHRSEAELIREAIDRLLYEEAGYGNQPSASSTAVTRASPGAPTTPWRKASARTAIAEWYGKTTLLTLDERHFRTVKPLSGDAFTLLPADSPPD